MNIVCTVCSELFIRGADIYFTPCGHVFHFSCLTNWIKRTKSCPICRSSVTEQNIYKVFFNIDDRDITEDCVTLFVKLENANFTLELKENELKNLRKSLEELKEQNAKLHIEMNIARSDYKEKTRNLKYNLKRAQNETYKQKKEKAYQKYKIAKLNRKIQELKLECDRQTNSLQRIQNIVGSNSSHNEKSYNQEDTSLASATMSVISQIRTRHKRLLDESKKAKHEDHIDYEGLDGTSKRDIFPSSKEQQTGMMRTRSGSSISYSEIKKPRSTR
ncbi:uncharacterized protein [Diabrotica undecimpunctata]|uniref:uncharacterized protein n=1 Tax=Diabrotica undecimpunctata TaxID=50387 RepID=UPI003B639572